MIRLFELILYGHYHKFKTVKEIDITEDGIPVALVYVQECECCGKLKQFKIRG